MIVDDFFLDFAFIPHFLRGEFKYNSHILYSEHGSIEVKNLTSAVAKRRFFAEMMLLSRHLIVVILADLVATSPG